ncbi:MAG: type II toxin-antitoxin system RelE/ParE family toxin [Pleurocapsa sp. MO_192.B19]|nr:type II toxin-antitoxin system RelE/ParE family toxin [Pleurocapsa sp. MO_192.B19]
MSDQLHSIGFNRIVRQRSPKTKPLDFYLGKNIYVLHAFQKKSKKGIKTPKQDIDLIKKRYQEALELAKNDR